MKCFLFFLCAIILFGSSCKVAQTTQIYVVRHADRTAQDDLMPAGIARANELSRVLFHAGIDSIFSTNSVRTTKTVKPLATAKGLPIILYSDIDSLLNRILKNSTGKTVLVAAHSNTVPQIITKCGCVPPFAEIPSTQFDDLFLIILQKGKNHSKVSGSCKLLQMKYGAVTN